MIERNGILSLIGIGSALQREFMIATDLRLQDVMLTFVMGE